MNINGAIKERFVFFGVQRGQESIGGRAKLFSAFSFAFLWLSAFFSHSRHLTSFSRRHQFLFFKKKIRARRKEGEKKGWRRDTYQARPFGGRPRCGPPGPAWQGGGTRGYAVSEVRTATSVAGAGAAGAHASVAGQRERDREQREVGGLVRGSRRSTRRERGGWLAGMWAPVLPEGSPGYATIPGAVT